MNVEKSVYRVLYRVLWNAVYEGEFKSNIGKVDRYSRMLWERTKNGDMIGTKFTNTDSVRFITSNYSEKWNSQEKNLDDLTLFRMLKYLRSDEKKIERLVETAENARKLMIEFEEKYKEEIASEKSVLENGNIDLGQLGKDRNKLSPSSMQDIADIQNEKEEQQTISESTFLDALETIQDYYKINRYLPDEIKSFRLLNELVKNRCLREKSIGHLDKASEFFEDENYWEIYELQDDNIIVRSFHYFDANSSLLVDNVDPALVCNVVLGKKGRIEFPVESNELDSAYFDMSQRTIRITDELTMHSIATQTTELFNFSLGRNFSGAYIGHKFCFDANREHGPEMTCSPAVLYGRYKELEKNENRHRYFYDEFNIQNERIPNFIRAFLIDWKMIKVDPQPFNGLLFTILEALEGYNAMIIR